MPAKFTGRCECGAITHEFNDAPDFVANCCCRDGQRSSGAVVATCSSAAQDDFEILSGDPRSHPYVAASGNTLERNFCPDCGARVSTDKLSGFPGQVFVMLGSVNDPGMIEPPIVEILTGTAFPGRSPSTYRSTALAPTLPRARQKRLRREVVAEPQDRKRWSPGGCRLSGRGQSGSTFPSAGDAPGQVFPARSMELRGRPATIAADSTTSPPDRSPPRSGVPQVFFIDPPR